jgi:gluconokinase
VGQPVVVVMGVSGCGKTTIGLLLSERTGWPFLDADTLHSAANIAKMHIGTPLTDEDRWPWLADVADWIAARYGAGEPGIVACSALKRSYRDRLREADPELRLAYLRTDPQTLHERLSHRVGHFFPQTLLNAQLTDLEHPTADEHPIIVPSGQSPDEQVDAILAAVNR